MTTLGSFVMKERGSEKEIKELLFFKKTQSGAKEKKTHLGCISKETFVFPVWSFSLFRGGLEMFLNGVRVC